MDEQRFYTVQEVGRILHLHEVTVYRHVATRQIPSVKVGARRLIPKEWVDRAIQNAIERVDLPIHEAWKAKGPRPVATPVYTDGLDDEQG